MGEEFDYKLHKWIKVLQDNWVFNVGTLLRLPPGSLDKMSLPTGLVGELEKIRKLGGDFQAQEFFFLNNDRVVSTTGGVASVGEGEMKFTLKISREQQDLVNSTFRALLKPKEITTASGTVKMTGLRQFENDFYPAFFRRSPVSARLFNTETPEDLEIQSRAFGRMLYWIVENLDSCDLSHTMLQLGGRHIIYGVLQDEYETFSAVACETFLHVLGDKIFTPAAAKAWSVTLAGLSQVMLDAGAVSQKGFSGQLKKERDNGSWQMMQVTLMLDMLIIYKDKNKKNLSAQYPLKSVTLSFAKDVTNCLVLSSTNPPFSVRLACLDETNFNVWIEELNWRIAALQRVYKCDSLDESTSTDSEGLNTTELSTSALTSSNQRKLKETKKQIEKKQKKSALLEQKRAQSISAVEKEMNTGLGLSEKQKELIKTSWIILVGKKITNDQGITKSGIGELFELFYAKLFEINPAGKRLFESSGLKAQGRALVSMIGMIVKSMDDFETFRSLVGQLGGRHKIYGVVPADYDDFTNTLAGTIAKLLKDEKSINCAEVLQAWKTALSSLSRMMIAASEVSSEPLVVVAQRKIHERGSWKKSAISVNLEALYFYSNEKLSKLRSSIPMNTITHIEVLRADDMVDAPTEFGVRIHYHDDMATVCFPSKAEGTSWASEVNWRVQAVQRVFKYDESDGTGSASQQEHTSKKLFSLAKKRKKQQAVKGI